MLILITPSIYDRGFVDATIFPKTLFLIQCLILIAVVFSIALMFVEISFHEVKISKIDLALLVFVVYVLLNRYLIQSDYNFSIRFIEFLGLSFFYLVIRVLPSRYYPWFLLSIVLSGLFQSVYGVVQLLGHTSTFNSRFVITGSFLNPGPYAGFLAASWSVSLGMYLFKESLINKLSDHIKERSLSGIYKAICVIFEYVPVFALFSILIALPATESRAAFLAVLLGSFVLILFKYDLFSKIGQWSIMKKGTILIIACVVFGVGLFGVYQLKKNSADGRVLIWKVTSTIIADHPVWGVGYDRFRSHYMDAQADYFTEFADPSEVMIADTAWFAFNEGLQLMVENGVLGLLIVILIGFWCISLKVSVNDFFLKQLIFGVLSTLTLFGLFSYPSQILPIKIIMVFCISILSSIDDKKYAITQPHKYLLSGGRYTVAFSSLLLIWMSFQFVNTTKTGFLGFKNALDSFYKLDPINKTKESTEIFETLTPILENDGLSLRLYGQLLTSNSQHEKAIEVLTLVRKHKNSTRVEINLGDNYRVLKKYELSEIAYQRAADMIPGRFYPHYLLAKLYEESGQLKKAEKKARGLLTKEIKIPSKAIEEMKAEMRSILVQKKPAFIENNKYKITL